MSLRLSRWLASLVVVLAAAFSLGAETLPPAPKAYFNDYAHVVSTDTAQTLNARLDQFERDTSNQVVVAVFSRLESNSSVEDYTVRVAQSWHVGQKDKNNGAVLFVFVESHQIYIQVGYGLEGDLPDATCKAIIDNELKPAFRAGNFDGGLSAAVNALIAATKGEYKGTGHTQTDRSPRGNTSPGLIFFGFMVFCVLCSVFSKRRGRVYGGSSGTGGWSSGGGSSGGGSSGGFSGGGGSFGGGGSGGSW